MNNVSNDNSAEYGTYIFVFSQASSIFLKIIQVFVPLVNVERIDDGVCCMFTITANSLVDSYNLDREVSGRRRRRRRRGNTTTAFWCRSQST